MHLQVKYLLIFLHQNLFLYISNQRIFFLFKSIKIEFQIIRAIRYFCFFMQKSVSISILIIFVHKKSLYISTSFGIILFKNLINDSSADAGR